MKVVLLGATRGMGRALARKLANQQACIFLLGRDLGQLARSARDLEIRGAHGTVGTARCDLTDPESFGGALDAADRALNGFDTVVVTAGQFASQQVLEADPKRRRALLTANFVDTVEFCEAVRERLLARGGGTLCVFSSVAGERGRKPVVLYGASKAGLTRYLEGLDCRFRAQGLRVVTVKPGFVATGMTEGLTPPPFAGNPDDVAAIVLRAIERGTAVVYAPRIWRFILFVIRALPQRVMRKLSF